MTTISDELLLTFLERRLAHLKRKVEACAAPETKRYFMARIEECHFMIQSAHFLAVASPGAAVITDSQRVDWMERYLQRPAELKQDDGTMKHVGAWALISPNGFSLRETIDAAMGGNKHGPEDSG